MKTLLTLSAVCLYPVAGFSQTLTTSSEYGLPVQLNTTEISEIGTLLKFDSSLGILTNATLVIYGGAEFGLTATNNSANPQSFQLTSSTNLSFSSSELGVDNQIQTQNPNIGLSTTTPLTTLTSGQFVDFGTASKSGNYSYDLNSVLSSVQANGGGSFTITAESLSGLLATGGGGNVEVTQSTMTGAGARITYTYTVVPEPSSASLIFLPALALCFRRKR